MFNLTNIEVNNSNAQGKKHKLYFCFLFLTLKMSEIIQCW